MGSIKGGEFIKKIINQINKTHSYYRSLHVPAFISFGPYCISNLYYSDNNSRLMTVLPANYFYPVHWMGVDQNKTKVDIEREYPDAFMFQFGYSSKSTFYYFLSSLLLYFFSSLLLPPVYFLSIVPHVAIAMCSTHSKSMSKNFEYVHSKSRPKISLN